MYARPEQLTPAGNWQTWLIQAGRGFGKTRCGAEDVKDFGLKNPKSRIAVVAPTYADARDVCIEGESGLLNILPPKEIKDWNRSLGELILNNGTTYKLYSAEKPDKLRGPQNHRAWCDELSSWRYLTDTWDMLQFGLRLGNNPQTVVTTTPKPSIFLQELIKTPNTHITRGSTYANRANLPQSFFDKVISKYEKTRLGRQEIYAELLTDTPGALWNISQLEATRVNHLVPGSIERCVVGIDPAVSNNEGSAETGIVVAGLGHNQHIYILDDCTVSGSPAEWANAAIAAYQRWEADRIVVEVNNGGDMCEAVLRNCPGGQYLPITKVRATRGKYVRAEPISALTEQGKYHHVGYFGELESQMTTFVPGEPSPDRMDAMVWAVTSLIGGSIDENFADDLINWR